LLSDGSERLVKGLYAFFSFLVWRQPFNYHREFTMAPTIAELSFIRLDNNYLDSKRYGKKYVKAC